MSNRPQKARIWHSFDRLYNCHSTPDSNHYRKPRTPIRPFCSCTTTNYAVSFCFFVLIRELPSSERWTQEALVVVVLVVVQHYISTQTVKNSEGKTENKKPIPTDQPITPLNDYDEKHKKSCKCHADWNSSSSFSTARHTHKHANDGKGVIGIHCLALIVPGNVTCEFFFPVWHGKDE